jgi:hypothetical protein
MIDRKLIGNVAPPDGGTTIPHQPLELAAASRDDGLDLGEHSGEAVETKRRHPSERAPVEESRYLVEEAGAESSLK